MKMPQTFENYTPWQENWSFHIPEEVHAKKVPIKIKKCAALHIVYTKKKERKVAGFKVIKNQSYSHLYVKIVTVDRLMQIVNATILSTMCKYFKMYNNFVLSSAANSTNTKSIQLNCTV